MYIETRSGKKTLLSILKRKVLKIFKKLFGQILPYYYIMGLVEDICLTAASAYHRVNNCFSTVSCKGKIPQN